MSNAVAPVASNTPMKAGDMVMVGIAPRYNGYAGVMGDTLPVSGEYTQEQKDCINVIREVFRKTRDALKPGETGKTLDPIGAKIYEKHDWTKYIVCPFVHAGPDGSRETVLRTQRNRRPAAGLYRIHRYQYLRSSEASRRPC